MSAGHAKPTTAATLMVLYVCCFALSVFMGSIIAVAEEENYTLAQMVFVSCNKHNENQSYWNVVSDTVSSSRFPTLPPGSCGASPPVDALIWLGDVVYADNFSFFSGCRPNTDMELVRSKFTQQRSAPEYIAFRQTCVRPRVPPYLQENEEETQRVMGVWDDHDMGKNDGGAEYEDKDVIQQFFLDFLGVSKNSTRRKQKGVYSFETVPFQASYSMSNATSPVDSALKELQGLYDHAACILLLDARYFRDPANATRAGDMLGETQWKWLEDRLRYDVAGRNPATGRERCALTVVGNGIQVIMDEKISENWGAFPHSRSRLFSLLRRYHSERVIFISGDVHLGEIGMDTTRDAVEALGYPILEATSSGLTHSSAKFWGLPSFITTLFPTPRRMGVYVERNFGVIKLTINPQTFLTVLKSTNKRSTHHLEKYINISVSIHSIPKQGEAVLNMTMPLDVFTIRSWNSSRDYDVDTKCNMDLSKNQGREELCKYYSYPLSTPVPALTSIARFFQTQMWPNHTLLEVVGKIISTSILIVIAMIAMYCITLLLLSPIERQK